MIFLSLSLFLFSLLQSETSMMMEAGSVPNCPGTMSSEGHVILHVMCVLSGAIVALSASLLLLLDLTNVFQCLS